MSKSKNHGAAPFIAAALGLCVTASLALAAGKDEPKRGPIEEVIAAYNKARQPAQKDGTTAGLVTLSQGDCKSFAKDFTKAGEKEKREDYVERRAKVEEALSRLG